MPVENPLSKETFLRIAEASGLDVNDPHIEELYSYLQGILPGLKAAQELDLTDVEPAMIFGPPRE